MSDLPLGWVDTTLQEVVAIEDRAITDGPFGSMLASRHYTSSGARVIRLQNIGDCTFNDERAYISLNYFEELRAHEVRSGDLVIASLGQDLPRACIIPVLGEPAIVKADCVRVRIHPEIEAKWILYALSAPQTRQRATSRIRGIGRPRLGLGEIRKLPIPLPPISEQRRIVATLEGHLSRLAAADQSILTNLRRALKLGQSIVDQVLSDVSGASMKSLASLLAEPLRNGHSARASDTGEGIRTLTLTAVTRGEFTDSNTKHTVADSSRVRDLWLRPGDILVERANTPELVGTSALYAGPSRWAIYPDLLIRVRVNEAATPEYVQLILSTTRLRSYFRQNAKGLAGSMPKIDQDTLLRAELPIPSIEEQERIVASIYSHKDAIDRLHRELEISRHRSIQFRRAILAEAFSGQLVLQDPADEPASVLLDRIRTARAASLRTGLGRKRAKPSRQKETLL